jgi:O-antigen/teichoic acid export membrane protein
MVRIRGVVQRFGWGIADQALSSLTNLLLALLVARSIGPRSFGAFSVAFTAYLIAMGLSRAISTDPLVVRFSAAEDEHWRLAASSATGTATAFGVITGVLCGLAGALIGGPAGTALIALAVTLPGLLLQDAWRFTFFSKGRAYLAFLNDLIWAIAMFSVFAILIVTDNASTQSLTLAWGGAATLAAAVGILQSRVGPRPLDLRNWFNEHRDLGIPFSGEFIATSGGLQFVGYGVAVIAGLSALGSLRGGDILLGPVRVVVTGLVVVAVPEGVRMLQRSAHDLLRSCVLLSSGLAVVSLLWGGVALVIPDRLGESLLGDTWSAAQVVLLPMALMVTFNSASVGAMTGLRVFAAARTSLRVRIANTLLTVAGGLFGAWVGGAEGAAWGLAAAAAIALPLWWRAFHRRAGEAIQEKAPAEISGQLDENSPSTSLP